MRQRRFGRVDNVLKEITPKSVDYSQWYVDVIKKADMVDYAPIKGFMVIKPYGYRIWEFIQAAMDAKFRATGHENAYFPLLIPENLLLKEAEHVEGFSAEVAWVTQGGSEPLTERLAVRPTSETIIGAMYSKWIQSYRDLPVLMNQWANVVRWEKATRPFLRTTEFLWQEGHTVHRTPEEALAETRQQLEIYRQVIEGELAIPVIAGRKSAGERFAGAVETFTLEALMGDGRALQIATSHFLGQNFAQAFDIQYLDEDGTRKFGWTTSWGSSTRMIGGLIMVHGDDKGLRLPPRVAPVQVVIVPIARGTDEEQQQVLAYARLLKDRLAGAQVRVRLDDRPEFTPGYKYNDWEMRGVPLRIEVGPKDLAKQGMVLCRRDTGEKTAVSEAGFESAVTAMLDAIQQSLLQQALEHQQAHTVAVENYREAEKYGHRGFFEGDWCGSEACADQLKANTGMTIRCLPLDRTPEGTGCVVCGQPSQERMLFARAY
ncbi:proline--tRNA ligase [Sulfobacillus harzensis]|uniref:Proline--tRNA ligase n=1 Tax=Sulfobacillus harzensis TaxID=2729629 RepID=A0A7Y0L3N6_9FIRM|nr:proline--tRNA ligase [Sulfobacillus harzensis]NMP21825.1 proline--tRNA ligase [Sulfobacillus harzensis]